MSRGIVVVALGGAGALLAALSMHSLIVSALMVVAAVLLGLQAQVTRWAVIGVSVAGLGCILAAFLLRASPVQPTGINAIAPGQYTASSGDLLGLVTVRAVFRISPQNQSPVMIFAEAHAPPFMGIDQQTLVREMHHALVHQSVTAAIDEQSDTVTARLVRSALAQIFSGQVDVKTPVIPDGAAPTGMGPDTYFGMFPNEFAHDCTIDDIPDGTYIGQSSNPLHPARVQVQFRTGRMISVQVIDFRASAYGQPAVDALPGRMVDENRVDVDVVSGATRTSYILRSAAFHACRNALKSDKKDATP